MTWSIQLDDDGGEGGAGWEAGSVAGHGGWLAEDVEETQLLKII